MMFNHVRMPCSYANKHVPSCTPAQLIHTTNDWAQPVHAPEGQPVAWTNISETRIPHRNMKRLESPSLKMSHMIIYVIYIYVMFLVFIMEIEAPPLFIRP